MTDEEFQRITGFIKSAVDLAEERFGERLDRRLAVELEPIRQDIKDLKQAVGDLKNDMRWVKNNMALESTVKERFEKFKQMELGDVGGVIQDMDRLKRIAANHEKRIAALEKTAAR